MGKGKKNSERVKRKQIRKRSNRVKVKVIREEKGKIWKKGKKKKFLLVITF